MSRPIFLRIGHLNHEVSSENFGELLRILGVWADSNGQPAIATLTVLPANAQVANDWINDVLPRPVKR